MRHYEKIFMFLAAASAIGCMLFVEAVIKPNEAYCFQFTWVGPSYDNSTFENKTCAELKYEACSGPIIVTNDQTPPNTTYLWHHYGSQVACRLTKGTVCVKWIYRFSDSVEYITYLCSKVAVQGEDAMTSGCLTQSNNDSYSKEVCACRSYPGQLPCNSAWRLSSSLLVPGLVAVALFYCTMAL